MAATVLAATLGSTIQTQGTLCASIAPPGNMQHPLAPLSVQIVLRALTQVQLQKLRAPSALQESTKMAEGKRFVPRAELEHTSVTLEQQLICMTSTSNA